MKMRTTIISLVAIAALAAGLHAQAPAAAPAPAGAPAQKSAKNWKDTAEYDLYSAIIKPDATPAARLQNLDKWKAAYPQSDYADTRQKIYLITYQALNNHRAAFDMAAETLKTDPNDLASIQEILGYVRALMPADPKAALSAQNKSDLETAEKVARYLMANAGAVFAADKKPQGATDAQWAQAKPTMEKFAQFTLGYIGIEEKDNAKAETELQRLFRWTRLTPRLPTCWLLFSWESRKSIRIRCPWRYLNMPALPSMTVPALSMPKRVARWIAS